MIYEIGLSAEDVKLIEKIVSETLQSDEDKPIIAKTLLTWGELKELNLRPQHGSKMITRNKEGVALFFREFAELIDEKINPINDATSHLQDVEPKERT